MIYNVNNVYIAIQGEGVNTGVPMVILRLHGCGVGCSFCDTKETWNIQEDYRVSTIEEAIGANEKWTMVSEGEIVDYIKEHAPGPKWILVTGGEPAQYPLRPLVRMLHSHGYKVALETSGTELGHLGAGFDWICVSPKIGMPGGKEVNLTALENADEIKWVIGKATDILKMKGVLSGVVFNKATQVCLQPMSTSKKATQICVAEVEQNPSYRLSVQVHRYIGID